MNTKNIAIFIVGLLLGWCIAYFICCKDKHDDNFEFTANNIINSDDYQNPDKKRLLRPHDFFNRYKSKMDDSLSTFAGIKIERKYLLEALAYYPEKTNLYIALAFSEAIYDKKRAKRLCITSNPNDTNWQEEARPQPNGRPSLQPDTIISISFNAEGKQVLEFESSVSSHHAYFCQAQTDTYDDWFDLFFKRVLPVNNVYAAPCVCRSCCSKVLGGNIAP